MKTKKLQTFFTAVLLFLNFPFFAAEVNLSLFEKAKEEGITVYWDSLSSLGILEKNGHQITFREGSELVMYDSALLTKTESPVIKNGEIFVSTSFMGTVENLFKESTEESPFKIGAILLDPGHGGKDPGASGSFTVGGKPLKVQEKDVVLSVGKILYGQLKEAYPEKRIIMTRNTDKYLTLGERTDI